MDIEKTKTLIFPLCLLNFPDERHNKYDKIISYSIVRFAKKLMETIDIEEEGFSQFIKRNKIIDFNKKYKLHKYIIHTCKILSITIGNITGLIYEYEEMNNFEYEYEKQYGKDAQVKVNNKLLFEVRDSKFNERLFRVYCAIKSLIGEKDFCRITLKTISYRMYGFKKLDIFKKEFDSINNYQQLSDRQIKTATEKLMQLKFFEKSTRNKRCTYYSVKQRDENFNTKLSDFLTKRKLDKNKSKIQNQIIDKMINDKYEESLKKIIGTDTGTDTGCKITDINSIEDVLQVLYG